MCFYNLVFEHVKNEIVRGIGAGKAWDKCYGVLFIYQLHCWIKRYKANWITAKKLCALQRLTHAFTIGIGQIEFDFNAHGVFK